MFKKRIFSILLCLALLLGVCGAMAASAGSSGDPLVSLSYLDGAFRTKLGSALAPLMEDASAKGTTGSVTQSTAPGGSTVTLMTGASAVFSAGSGQLHILSGVVVDVTAGKTVSSGTAIALNHRYMAAEDSFATITTTARSVLFLDGGAILSAVTSFTDISSANWYYNDVLAAVSRGLINGYEDGTFRPRGSITVAETIKLAACLHQLYTEGSITLKNSGTAPWYGSFVDYALKNGIISGSYPDYTKQISRRDFVKIFYNAMPASNYTEINSVANNAIPDIPSSDPDAAQIYAFYRAGILTGDLQNRFNPDASIVRSEVAALLTRMYDSSARMSVTLP